MTSLENETRVYLKTTFENVQDNTKNQDLDFYVDVDHKSFFIEVKEKRQKYNMNNWKSDIPQEHLFILDDVCARKCFFAGPYGMLLIRDNTLGHYYVCDMLTLFFMKKDRVNRPLEDGSMRGKIFVDLRQCTRLKKIEDLKLAIKQYCSFDFTENQECFTPFPEEIGSGGKVRLKTTQKHDYFATR